MNNSPSTIFNCAFCPPEIASEQNDFFRCKNSLNIIRYMDRNGAADKLSDADPGHIRDVVQGADKRRRHDRERELHQRFHDRPLR